MTSQVNPSNINGNYPIAGQDNDSQGFRDNFTNIKNNFYFIKQEVEDLQSKSILSSALTGTTLNNDFLNSQVKNIQTKNLTETVYDWGQQGGATAVNIQLDFALGNIHKLTAQGAIIINSVIKNWPGALQFSRLLLYINIPLTTYTLTLPSNVTTDLSGIPGLRTVNNNNVITFTDTGNYIFEFSSVNSGTDIFIRELTKGNAEFRDPNFYLAGIGGYTQPSLRIGWGNLIAVSSLIDSGLKGNADVLSVRGGITSYMNSNDSGNDPSTVLQGGFTVAKSRATEPTGVYTEAVVASGDYVGYFNAVAYTGIPSSVYNAYQRIAAIDMHAIGSQTSIGGNIVISTKTDGGAMAPAVTIDNAQNVTIYGNLDVRGATTYIESTIVTIKDKNIILANGSVSTDAASTSGVQIETGSGTYANILYYGPAATNTSTGRFDFNNPVNVSVTTTSTDSGSGALVVKGGVGIGGALNVAGTFGLTSTTDATNTTTAAFALLGGMATAKNIIAGTGLFANGTTTASSLVTGAFQVQGGAAIKGNLYVGGQSATGPTLSGLYVLATSTSTSTATGAAVIKGGLGVAGPVFLSDASSANGVTVSSTLTSTGTQLTASNLSGRTASVAFRVKGGSILEGNLVLGAGGSATDTGAGRLFIDSTASGAAPAFTAATMAVDFTQGAIVVGNSTVYGGITLAGDLFMGTDNTGTIFTAKKSYTLGVPVQPSGSGNVAASLNPYTPQNIGGTPGLGALTVKGGANLMSDVFIGQPWTGATGTAAAGQWTGYPNGAFSGNLNLLSGTQSRNFGGGALIIANVGLPDGTFSQGGAGIAGNLWVNGGVYMGSIGTSNSFANAVAVATTNSTSSTTGALVVATGGLGVSGNTVIGGNITVQGPFYPINAVGASGVAMVRSDGANFTTTSATVVDPVTTATSTSSTIAVVSASVTGSISGVTLTTSAGSPAIGMVLSGNGIIPGTMIISGSSTTWTLSIPQPTTSSGVYAGTTTTLTVGGSLTGTFAVGTLLSGTGIDPRTQIQARGTGSGGAGTYFISGYQGAIASGQAINGTQGFLGFQAAANSAYSFEAWIYHNTSAAASKGFQVNFTGGTVAYTVEQQSAAGGSMNMAGPITANATIQTQATSGAVTGMVARIQGTWTGSSSALVWLQMNIGSAATLTVYGNSYFKWTRLY